ncbi:hypothetical protein Rt10032_c19g6257 [Rhodotorula toruloides]|uniref:RNA binding protein n=1 Tax=Rhodotorula toruloides TaxID=5286 RepID=A0A511KPE4_RHOTO|nr:hypothetical protein Rt10032_c19g6257 [Rhodotorula toruloides]
MSNANTAIDDYLVASFPLPASSPSSSSPRQLHPAALDVTAVQYTRQARQDSRLAVATPGVGVPVYDLADQTPLSSITVGPSFAPTTAAVSRSTPSTSSPSIRVKSARTTWVGVETPEGKGEIWCWHEEERKEGSTEGDAGKAIWPISEPLAAVAAPRTLPSHIVFLSSSGALALAPADDLTSLASLPAPSPSTAFTRQTLRLIPISPTSAPDFLPPALVQSLPAGSKAHLAIIVRLRASATKHVADGEPSSLVEIGQKKFKKTPRPSSSAVIDAADATTAPGPVSDESEVELVLLDAEVSVPDEFEPKLGLVSLGKVEVKGRQVVVSDDGFVTALSSDGVLSSFRLSIPPSFIVDAYSSLFFPPEPTSFPTPTLSSVKSLTLCNTALIPSRASLLALHASFIALAAPRRSSTDSSSALIVSITFWDARFGSVTASTDLSVPSAVSTSLSALSLSLSLPNRHTAILALSPSSGTGNRMALFALPLTPLPTHSVLAAVVGKHTLTSRFLASRPAEESVLAKAKRAEPLQSLAKPVAGGAGEKKAVLVEASRKAREAVLERLEGVVRPLKDQAAVGEQDEAVREAERVWSDWLEAEKDRLWEYNKDKVRVQMEKEKERRLKAILDGDEGDEGEVTRYKKAKKRIERALVEAGAAVRPGTGAGVEEMGKKSWKDVTAARIKGVNDKYRYMYHRERNKMEEEMGKTVDEFDWDEAVNKVERYEPSLPSSFITALLRLSFPVPLDAPSSDLVAPSTAPATSDKAWRHPTKIVAYLLKRELVGENQVEGGVTRFLARAGDWPNILTALKTIPDIPESTTVSLLVTVVRNAQTSAVDSMDVEAATTTVPTPVPSLPTFLRSFLKSPYTPSVLRSALRKQLSSVEAVSILEQCDQWLATWLKSAQAAEEDEERRRKRKGKGSKAVQVDLFKLVVPGEEEQLPSLAEIVPFVQAVLDAHFVTLLLQRQAHRLLRRLAQHISLHTQLVNDLSSLLGAVSIYSRKKDEQRRAALEEASAAIAEKQRDGVREFGETMERRIKAQEKHAEVGAYAVEEFFL